MNCREISLFLSAYLDGELAGREQAVVAAHLPACAACRRRLENLKLAQSAFAAYEPAPASAGFERKPRSTSSHMERLLSFWRKIPEKRALALGLAGLLLVLQMSINFNREMKQSQPERQNRNAAMVQDDAIRRPESGYFRFSAARDEMAPPEESDF
ncbi:MAG: zf-HC2 domain-containing protein [Elusimicrobiales bacterium]|nr:zf-HC2 domain-containing protein [Elusimicrobiales bacterium]